MSGKAPKLSADEIERHLVALKYDICDKSADCQPCQGIREKSIEIIEHLKQELDALSVQHLDYTLEHPQALPRNVHE